MTDKELFKQVVTERGLKLQFVAEKMGMKSMTTLYNKLDNKTDFTALEIAAFRKLTGIDLRTQEKIFFANDVAV